MYFRTAILSPNLNHMQLYAMSLDYFNCYILLYNRFNCTPLDIEIPSEEEQLKWALNESKALLSNTEQDDSDDDDPELARVLQESRALFEQGNAENSSRTPSPDASPSLLEGGAGCNSNNNTGDSGYCGSSIDLTLDDLQHKVGGAKG